MSKFRRTSILVIFSILMIFGLTNNVSAASTSLGSYSVNTIGNWYSSKTVTATGTSMAMNVTVTNAGGRADLQVYTNGSWKDVDGFPVELQVKKTYSKTYTVKKGSKYRVKITPNLFKGTGSITLIQ
ncbi:MAG: hypothetical protein WAM95_18240 [Bacillus sp. (in: firmicutes)]